MPDERPLPDLAQVVAALQRLDAQSLVGWAFGDDDARGRLRSRVQRLRTKVTTEAIYRFADEQDDLLAEMLSLLDDWKVMLRGAAGTQSGAVGATRGAGGRTRCLRRLPAASDGLGGRLCWAWGKLQGRLRRL